MGKAESKRRLAEVKLALARKYEHLARVAHSQPKRKQFQYHAARYRREAERLSH